MVKVSPAPQVRIKVPAGVDTGSVLRLAGGRFGNSRRAPCDLLVHVRVRPIRCSSERDNVIMELPISLSACSGDEIEFLRWRKDQIEGAGDTAGAVFYLRARNTHLQGYGRIRSLVKVVIPTKLNESKRDVENSIQQ